MFQMWIVSAQITINLGGSCNYPQKRLYYAKIAKVAIRAPLRSSTNRERESCRRHPYQMLSFEKDDTHTPSSLCCVVVLSGYHRRAPFNCPTIQRTNWNASRFPVAPTVVNIFIRSSLNHRHQYFVQKLTTLRGAGVPPLGPECQFAKGN